MAKKTSKKKAPKKTARKTARPLGNGLRTFSMHSGDEASHRNMRALAAAESTHPAFAAAASAASVDPETAARRYLDLALGSPAVSSFTAPVADEVPSEFKSLDTETVPLTGTTMVKFRQYFSKIPVYGSLVTVELDDANKLLGINSALGSPDSVSPVAKISPADAVKAVKAFPGHTKDLDKIVPRLNYYYDRVASKWRLVFIVEDVPVVSQTKRRSKGVNDTDRAEMHSPVLMDYIVDANTGKVVTELPRTPTAAAQKTATDGLGTSRTFEVDKTGGTEILIDATLNIQTFDFKFKDPAQQSQSLPGTAIKNPPTFSPAAISAHANAAVVSTFLRTVLKRNNIDNQGGVMRSSINCVVVRDSPGGNVWINAFWNGRQMVYGQRRNGSGFLSMAIALDVVGHEMFHGVTDMTSRLEYAFQSGALNESYSDIFGIIIANQPNPDPRNWNWKLGAGLLANGKPFRDMSAPKLHGQPDHMRNFQNLPNTREGDNGGVHINSGIHNKAAFNILTAEKNGALVFTPGEVAAFFYIALTQRLSRTSQFTDSRTAVLDSARSLFRNLPPAGLNDRISAIQTGFSKVGIN
jgi:Zn-dependent metalloprotease